MTLHYLVVTLEISSALVLTYFLLAFLATFLLVHPSRLHSKFTPKAYGMPFKPITFFSLDGKTKLAGWVMRHDQLSKGLVILCHGLGATKSDLLPIAAFLFRNEFDCMAFDFRAHGESEGFLSNLGIAEAKDILGALRYSRENHLTPDGKACVVALSMGAAASLYAAAKTSDIQALICDSPYSDGSQLLKENFSVHFHGLPYQYFWKTCKSLLDLLGKYPLHPVRPIDAARHVAIPVLFIHGEKDETIPAHHSQDVFNKCASTDKEIWLVPGAGHLEAYEQQPDTYNRKILNFLESHIGARESSGSGATLSAGDGVVEVAAGVIVDDGKVLVAKRIKGTHLEGLWEFPGGKLNPGETPQLGVIREIREEVNLEVIVENCMATLDFAYPKGPGTAERNVRIHFFKCRVMKGKAAPIKWGELRWVSKNELDRIAFPEANAPILPKVKEYLL